MTIRTVEMDFEYNNYIMSPPVQPDTLYHQACSNDGITVKTWKPIWISQMLENHKRFGSFKEHSLGKLYNKYECMPVVCVGSGPSLKHNGQQIKKLNKKIPVISCLHNFHYFVDNEIPCNYFVSLDAGDVVIEEIYEGGSKTKEEYFEATKNYTLLAFIGSNPKLFEVWKGPIYLFNCPVPDKEFIDKVNEVDKFNVFISTGGNVLGACTYIAKAVFGCNPLCFLGADFSFSYLKKFHGWDSKYDKNMGQALRAIDVWGNKVYTWQSYFNFKSWFDWLSMKVPGIYINCTEGGLMGAYPEGNLFSIQQMPFENFIRMYELSGEIKDTCEDPTSQNIKILF